MVASNSPSRGGCVMVCSVRTVLSAPYGVYYTESGCVHREACVELHPTPFETEMIRDAQHFVGRWHDVQQLVQAVDQRRAVVVCGPPRSGRSSLLFHIVTAAAVLFEHDEQPAFYLDLTAFPDVASAAQTIVTALAPAGTSWEQALLRAPIAPLITLDGIDAPHLGGEGSTWLAALAGDVVAGRLRVIASADADYHSPTGVTRVVLRGVGASFVREYLAVMLPDGPLPSRADQQFVATVARGHLGTVVTVLVLWYQSLHDRDFDWQTRAMGLQPMLAVPAPTDASGALLHEAAADSRGTAAPIAAHASLPAVESSRQLVQQVPGWVVVVCLVVAIVLLWWGR